MISTAPNGVRYPGVGGMRERHFAGTSFQPRKLPENAATPTRRVHAVLGGFSHYTYHILVAVLRCHFANLQQLAYEPIENSKP